MKNLPKQPIHISLTMILILLVMLGSPAAGASPSNLTGRILYTRPATSADCSSWLSACELTQALSLALPGDEIWAAAGTYYPGPPGNQQATFQLKDGVALYGGFSGIETSRSQRDWLANETILSGDIDRNSFLDAGNAYHVVNASDVSLAAVLDGFTITGGNASGDIDLNGGGLYSLSGSPSLANLVFSANKAKNNGGGVYLYQSNPKLSSVSFINNIAKRGGGLYNNMSAPLLQRVSFSANNAEQGGGLFNYIAKDIRMTELAFTSNTASYGGGMYSAYSPCTLTAALFHANTAERGGGSYAYYSPCTLTNLTFHANAASLGGGMYSTFSDSLLTNLTLYTNTSTSGGAIYNLNGSAELSNAIVWGNSPLHDQLGGDPATFSYNYSLIQTGTGYEGMGNVFVNPLLSELSDNGGFSQTHALLPGSPAIDAGDPSPCPTQDQRGELRPADGNGDGEAVCDMGAYELQELIRQIFLPAVLGW